MNAQAITANEARLLVASAKDAEGRKNKIVDVSEQITKAANKGEEIFFTKLPCQHYLDLKKEGYLVKPGGNPSECIIYWGDRQ